VAACGGAATTADDASPPPAAEPLTVSAIPDQDPQELQRLYGLVSDHLERQLGVPVEYVPVTDYNASVNLFRSGDLDLVWFGGLTGVQARLQTPGAEVIAQRDIDADFHSVFIVNSSTGLEPVDDVSGLTALRGLRFTFGSESSTSGRLMPQHFLEQAGVSTDDFAGEPGFSGSHDKTIDLVESGSFEAGVLNEQVWQSRLEAGSVDTSKVQLLLRTPAYHDYHWVLGPSAVERFGADLPDDVRDAFLGLSPSNGEHAAVLDLFGADRFIPAQASDYDRIEQVARELGLIR
jgi:phosphonate transport system substrate-binding protein